MSPYIDIFFISSVNINEIFPIFSATNRRHFPDKIQIEYSLAERFYDLSIIDLNWLVFYWLILNRVFDLRNDKEVF